MALALTTGGYRLETNVVVGWKLEEITPSQNVKVNIFGHTPWPPLVPVELYFFHQVPLKYTYPIYCIATPAKFGIGNEIHLRK